MKGSTVIEYNNVKFWMDRGILFCKIINTDASRLLPRDRVEKYIETIKNLTNARPTPFIVDMRHALGSFSIDVAKFLANNPVLNSIRLCEAFITSSINTKLLVHSYKRIFEPTTPFQIFDNPEQAINYCLTIKKNNICKL